MLHFGRSRRHRCGLAGLKRERVSRNGSGRSAERLAAVGALRLREATAHRDRAWAYRAAAFAAPNLKGIELLDTLISSMAIDGAWPPVE